MKKKYMSIRRISVTLFTVAIITSQLCGCASASKDDVEDLLNETSTVEIELDENETEIISTIAETEEADKETEKETETTGRSIEECMNDAAQTGVIPEDKMDLLRDTMEVYLAYGWDTELAFKQAVIDVTKILEENQDKVVGNGQGEGVETEEWMKDWGYDYRLYPESTDDEKGLFKTEEEFKEALKANGYDGRYTLNTINFIGEVWIKNGEIYYSEEEYLAVGGTEEATEEVTEVETATEGVTEGVTEGATEEATEQVVEGGTEEVTEEVTEEAETATEKVAEGNGASGEQSVEQWVISMPEFGESYSYKTEEEFNEVLLRGTGSCEIITPTYSGKVWTADGKIFYNEQEYNKYLDPNYGVDPFESGWKSDGHTLTSDVGKGVTFK